MNANPLSKVCSEINLTMMLTPNEEADSFFFHLYLQNLTDDHILVWTPSHSVC